MDYTALPPDELVIACFQAGDELAWVEFVGRFHPLIARVVFRVARKWGETSTQVIDDLVQDTYLKLCAERAYFLQSFRSAHKGAIYGYIKVFAANLAHDHFKAHRSEKRGGVGAASSIGSHHDCESAADSKSGESLIERSVLIQQIDACLKTVLVGPHSERDRRIFWLYYRIGLAASAIAALPAIGLSTKGVESTLLRLTRQIRERLGARTQAVDSNRAEGIQPTESL